MQNRQIDKKTTKQVRIDAGLHQLLKVKSAKSGMTLKALVEDYLSELLAVDSDEVYVSRSNSISKSKEGKNNG